MPADSYGHELRRKKAAATHHAVSARKIRSDSGYSTSSSASSNEGGSSHKTRSQHQHQHHSHAEHGPASSSSSSSSSGSKRSRARFSVPEDAQGLSKFASLTGYLRKQADNEQGAWNKYYFALRPTTYLYYYNSPSDDRPRGIIDLEFLQDIRYNDECLTRCVGGSEHCFRVTGQMPRGAVKDKAGSEKLKMRPVYLDPETPDEAAQWMEALKTHRFNVDHAEGYHKMAQRTKETEQTLKKLGDEAQRVVSIAESIRKNGRALLNKLRGIPTDPAASDDPDSRGSFDVDSNHIDIFSTLQELESLVEDFSAETEQQARMIETLRARENQQAKVIEDLREREAQQEEKMRDLAKLAAAARKQSSAATQQYDAGATSTYNSVISADELSRMERMGATKGRSASDVRELFKKTAGFLSSKKQVDDSSPRMLASLLEAPEEDEEAPARKIGGGFVDAIKKRVGKSSATTLPHASTPTSRGSDDTVSISTDDRGSAEVAEVPLPPGWTKRESRNSPGDFYYAHVSGFTCWDIPNDFLLEEDVRECDEPPQSQPSQSQLGSLAEVAQAAMEAEVAATAAASSQDEDKPAKKASGWGFLKKLSKPALAKAQSPKEEPAPAPSPVVAVEHDDGRHEF